MSNSDFAVFPSHAGVDEAGRGPLAGSVFAAAVILPAAYDLPGLADSKKLSEKQRDRLAAAIKEQATAWSIASANVAEILELNILHATMLAMRRAVAGLARQPEKVWIDGNRVPQRHPEYGFERHKGYGTAEHLAALRRHGALPEHRAAFAPVREVLAQGQLFGDS